MYVLAHGGAGTLPDEPADRQGALGDAVERGRQAEGPLAAVCRAVRPLERHPACNAGVGGAVQGDGAVRERVESPVDPTDPMEIHLPGTPERHPYE